MAESGFLNLKVLPFEEAVKLFKEWGFQVEPGPRAEEVTVILEEPDYRSYCVYPACELPQIAAAALRVRWRNAAVFAVSESRKEKPKPGFPVVCPMMASPVRIH